jgi:hypothetical protein
VGEGGGGKGCAKLQECIETQNRYLEASPPITWLGLGALH